MTSEVLEPSPNTVWVPTFQRWQPRHPFDAARAFGSVGRGGMKSAALCASPSDAGVGSAVLRARWVGARAVFLLVDELPAGRARVIGTARGVRLAGVLLLARRRAPGFAREPVSLAVLVRLIVLLSVLEQPMLPIGSGHVSLERSIARARTARDFRSR